MTRILMVACLCALAGPVLAGNGAETDVQTSQRDRELGLVGKLIGADRRERVRATEVYDPFEALIVGQRYVNQYIFENDSEALARDSDPRDQR